MYEGGAVRTVAECAGLSQGSDLSALVDRRLQSNGLILLAGLSPQTTPLAFLDPQYRGIMDYQRYGNEGARQKGRANLPQMSDEVIKSFLAEISRVLTLSGHLMLWVDKFHLAEGVSPWLSGLDLKIVDLITWEKGRMGMGYRTRRACEYLLVIQKRPIRAKGVWTSHNLRDVWSEKCPTEAGTHVHAKPVGLQSALIRATTVPGDIVLDPAAGSYSVMKAAHSVGRRFLGCDLLG